VAGIETRHQETHLKSTVHTIDTAPEAARADLQAARQSMGFLPNLLGVMAEAPIALKAYLDLTDLLAKSSFTPVEQQIMMIAGSVTNQCEYCVAAHSTLAGVIRMPAPVLEALRSNSPLPETKLEALRTFVVAVINERGRVSDARIQQFLDAGYTRQNVLEVVFGVAMKTLSNYTNHIMETPLDPQFSAHRWNPAA
jgi:uncharacterized peroxidase-related enzyme